MPSNLIKEEDIKNEPESYGYKSENYDKGGVPPVKQEVKVEPRDIDMRKSRRESESYSPTRPDYKPSIKQQGNILRLGRVIFVSKLHWLPRYVGS